MTHARTPFMAGNWKMNLNHLEAIAHVQAIAFSLTDDDYDAVEVGVMVPFTDIRSVQTLTDADKIRIVYGSQDISAHDSGAYTGEISGPMLAKLGCTYAVVGHSERRADHGETDALVRAKAAAVMQAGMVPVVCVGELEAERAAGRHEDVVVAQLRGSLAGLSPARADQLVVAYEPVWAIGTGRTATAEDAQAMCALTRQVLHELFGQTGTAVRVLYGGSVKPGNAAELFAQADIDGGLVGGASLDRDSYLAIARAARADG
jgi:triosephosphate isomerase